MTRRPLSEIDREIADTKTRLLQLRREREATAEYYELSGCEDIIRIPPTESEES